MLEIFRKKVSGIMTITIISVIVLAFAFLGLGDYFRFGGDSSIAAIVDGKKIPWSRVETVFHRMHKHFGQNTSEQAIKEQVRLALVQRHALLSSASKLGFQINDEHLAETLLQMPAFQNQGKFSKERYFEVLQQASYSDKEFRQELAQDLLIAQLEQGLMQSNFSLSSEVARLLSLAEQKRDFGYFKLEPKNYRSGIKIDPKDIQAYYENNKATFVNPEQVAIDYVTLSLEELAKPISASDQELNHFYEQHKASYTAPEARRVKHILIAVAPNSQEDEKAKAKITQLLDELKQGADFEKLAQENSMDPGTKDKGGDLGWFTRGQMVPEFEQAAFSMKEVKEFAGPIRTQFGYHVLQLVDKKSEETRPFTAVKNLVKEQFQREKAQILFAENTESMSKLGFEHSDTLEPIAKNLKLKIVSTKLFPRQGGADDAISRNPKILQAAFSEEVLNNKHNSEPVHLDDNTAVIIRVKQHQPTEQQTLTQVEKQIEERLITEKAQKKIQEFADLLAKQLKDKVNPNVLASTHKISWHPKKDMLRNAQDFDQQILSMAFEAKVPSDATPSVNTFMGASGDYIVLAVTKVHDVNHDSVNETVRLSYKKGLSDLLSQLEFNLYANQIFTNVKAEFPNPKK